MGDLEAQLKALERSPKFQRMVAQAQREAVRRGQTFGHGSDAVSPEAALKKADELRRVLYKYIREVIDSFEEDDIEIGTPRPDENGNYIVELRFRPERVWRPSLTGEGGVDNIVLLFSKGYDAGAQVYGEWHGSRIGSRTHLEGDDFLLRAIDEYERDNPMIQVTLDEKYM